MTASLEAFGGAVFPFVSLCAAIATVWALVLAKRHESHLKGHELQLERQYEGLQKISSSLSTKYIKEFPDYLPDIEELVLSARKSLRVMCTYPQHGAFSQPETWKDIKNAITEKISEDYIEAEMVFSSAHQRVRADVKQFEEAISNWSSWRDDNRDRLQKYISTHRSARVRTKITSADPDSRGGLKDAVDWLWFQDESERATVFDWHDHARIYESDHLMPLFVWIVDDREAVFVIMTYDHEVLGYGFKTVDMAAIKSLIRLFDRYAADYQTFITEEIAREEVAGIIDRYFQRTDEPQL